MDQLREDLKRMEARVVAYNKREAELMEQLDDSRSASLPFKIDFDRLKLENETLKQRVEHKEDELNETVLKLLDTQKALATLKLESDSGREALKKEVQLMKESNLSLRQQLEKSHKQVHELQDKVNEAQKDALDQELAHETELDTQARLVEVQKKIAQVAEERAADLEKVISELEAAMAEEKAARKAQLGEMEKEVEEKLAEKDRAHEESVEKLRAELKTSQEQVESFRKLPLAVKDLSESASNLELEKRGISVTSLYAQVIELREESMRDKEEIKRLNQHLERILADIEKKAPAVAELREEYERAIAAYDDTCVKLVDVTKDYNALRASVKAVEDDREEHRNRAAVATQEAKDLAYQVQSLLKSQLRHSNKSLSTPAKKYFPEKGVNTADEIISENLVPITSVNDLQSKNQQLLRVIRQLTKEREAEESKRSLNAETHMELKLKAAMQELEEMRDNRKRQEEMVSVIINQRDMYRTLLNQSDAPHSAAATASGTQVEGSASTSPVAPAPGSPLSKSPMGKALVESAGLNQTLQNTLAEFAQFRAEASKSADEFSAALKKEQEKTGEALLEVSRAQAEVSFNKERLMEMKEMMEGERKECVRLREVQSRLEEQLTQNAKVLAQKEEDMKATLKRERLLGAETNALKVDKRILEQEVEQLKVHLKDLKAQLETQKNFSKSFQVMESAIKTEQSTTLKALRDDKESLLEQVKRLEAQAFESEKKTADKCERLAGENSKLQAEVSVEKAQTATLKEQLATVKAKLETSVSKEKLLRQQLERTNRVAAQVRELRAKSTGASTATGESASGGSSEEKASGGEDVAALRERVAKREKDVETYKQIAAAKEKALQGLEESNQKMAQQLEKQAAQVKSYQAKLASSTADGKAQREEIAARASELDTQLKEANAQISVLQTESKDLKEREKALVDALKLAKQRASDLDDRWFKDHERYVGDMDTLKTLKQTVETLRSENKRLSEEVEKLNLKSSELEIKYRGELTVVEQKCSVAEKDVVDLRRQNTLLTDQLTRLTDQAKVLQRQQLERQLSNGEAPTESKEESEVQKEVARLRELVEIANRHKSVAVLEKEEAQHEVRRLKQQKNTATKEVETLKVQLESFGEGGNKKVVSASEHERLLAALQESVVLRKMQAFMTAEHEDLKNKLEAAEAASKVAREKATLSEKSTREVQTKIRTYEAERAALQREAGLYKKRYEELMANFGTKVDPQEHEKMKAAKEALKQQLDALNAKFSKLQSELRELQLNAKRKEQELAKHLEMKEKLREAASIWKGKYKALKEETEKQRAAQKAEAEAKALAMSKAKLAAKPPAKAVSVAAAKPISAKAGTKLAGHAIGRTKAQAGTRAAGKRTHSVISSKPSQPAATQDSAKTASPTEVGPPKKKGKVLLKLGETAKAASASGTLKRSLPPDSAEPAKKLNKKGTKKVAQVTSEKSAVKTFEKPPQVLLDRQKIIAANKAKFEAEQKRRQEEEALKARIAKRRQLKALQAEKVKTVKPVPASLAKQEKRAAEIRGAAATGAETVVAAKQTVARTRAAPSDASQAKTTPASIATVGSSAMSSKKQEVQNKLEEVRRKLAERQAQTSAQAANKPSKDTSSSSKPEVKATESKEAEKPTGAMKVSKVDLSAKIAKLKGEAKEQAAEKLKIAAQKRDEGSEASEPVKQISLKTKTLTAQQRAARRLERFNAPVEAKTEAKEMKQEKSPTPVQPPSISKSSVAAESKTPGQLTPSIIRTPAQDASEVVDEKTKPATPSTTAAPVVKAPASVVSSNEAATGTKSPGTDATIAAQPTSTSTEAAPPVKETDSKAPEAAAVSKSVSEAPATTSPTKEATPKELPKGIIEAASDEKVTKAVEAEPPVSPTAEITMVPADMDNEDEDIEDSNMLDEDDDRSASEEEETDSMGDEETKEDLMEDSKHGSDEMSAEEDENSDGDEDLEAAKDEDNEKMEEGGDADEVIVLSSDGSEGEMDDKEEENDVDVDL